MAKEQLTEMEQEELEAKRIQNELARLQLADLQAQLTQKKGNKERGHRDAMKAIEDLRAVQARCNHHVGGEGGIAVAQGQGDPERPTCIGAMQFLDESIRLSCGRCRSVWHSSYPDGSVELNYRPWAEGVQLWRRSVNKQMMVIGGLKIVKQANPLL